LGIIRGRAEYIALMQSEDASLQKSVQVILGQADRMSKLIRSLLNLSRGEHKAPAGEVLLDEIIAEVSDVIAGELKKADVELVVKIPAATAIKVRAEAGPLHQVFLNLLVNALQAIEAKGGHQKKIFITAERAGTSWRIAIADTGIGIPQKDLKKLFQPFFTTKAVGVGTGLGLATCYRIIESWKGNIQVESREGEGTTFYFTLPSRGN
ncbi:MAG: HAMP domain-containing histidine kinase, partial [Proteobacteria bacterium]